MKTVTSYCVTCKCATFHFITPKGPVCKACVNQGRVPSQYATLAEYVNMALEQEQEGR